jgi:hypothetical protein
VRGPRDCSPKRRCLLPALALFHKQEPDRRQGVKKSFQENIPQAWLAEYDTGIYRDPPKQFSRLKTVKDWEAYRLRAEAGDKELFDLDQQLAEAKQFAEKVLDHPSVQNRTVHNWKGRWDYAIQVLAYVKLVREQRKQGNWEKVTVYSYWLGRYYEGLRVRRTEHNAARGRKTGPNPGRRGHVEAYGTPQQKQARWALYQVTVDALFQQFPRWNYDRLCREAGKRHKVSAKTIERHTTNPRV